MPGDLTNDEEHLLRTAAATTFGSTSSATWTGEFEIHRESIPLQIEVGDLDVCLIKDLGKPLGYEVVVGKMQDFEAAQAMDVSETTSSVRTRSY